MTNDFDIQKARGDLKALRDKYGANTPIGHRCSNLMEMLENIEGATGDQRRELERSIGRQLADLARLTVKS
jgi:hypothetical protein